MKKMLIGALTLSLAVAASAGALAEKYNLMFSHTADGKRSVSSGVCAVGRRGFRTHERRTDD